MTIILAIMTILITTLAMGESEAAFRPNSRRREPHRPPLQRDMMRESLWVGFWVSGGLGFRGLGFGGLGFRGLGAFGCRSL